MASGVQHYQMAGKLLAAADATSDRILSNNLQARDEVATWSAVLAAQIAGAQAHATLALAAASAMTGLDDIAQNGEDFYDAEEDAARNWAKAVLSR